MLGNAQDTVYGDPDWTASLDAIAPNMTSVITANQATGESWLDAALRLAPQLLMTWQQKELFDMQMDRAARGLPPLTNIQDYTGLGVNVGMTSGTQKVVLGVAALFAVAYVLPKLAGRR